VSRRPARRPDDAFRTEPQPVKLQALQKEYVVELEDAVVVVRDTNGKVHLKQAVNLAGIGAASGAVWGGLFGVLVGVLFLNPLVGFATGVAVGAGTGALSAALADYGINDNFIKSMANEFPPGTSGLFILARRMNFDKVLPELKAFGGKVLKTSLSNEEEEHLRHALEGLGTAPA
jgi:uncharacterized membrane protein